MRVSILQENLYTALKTFKAIKSSRTLPILACVHLHTEDRQLVLTYTNLDCAIVYRIGAGVDIAGAICLPLAALLDWCKHLPARRIDMELDAATQTATLTCGGTSTQLKGIHADEYPLIPIPVHEAITIDHTALLDALTTLIKAKDEEHYLTTTSGQWQLISRHSLTTLTLDTALPEQTYRLQGMTTFQKLVKQNKDEYGVLAIAADTLLYDTGAYTFVTHLEPTSKLSVAALASPDAAITCQIGDLLRALKQVYALRSDTKDMQFGTLAPSSLTSAEGHTIPTLALKFQNELGDIETHVQGTGHAPNIQIPFAKWLKELPAINASLTIEFRRGTQGHQLGLGEGIFWYCRAVVGDKVIILSNAFYPTPLVLRHTMLVQFRDAQLLSTVDHLEALERTNTPDGMIYNLRHRSHLDKALQHEKLAVDYLHAAVKDSHLAQGLRHQQHALTALLALIH